MRTGVLPDIHNRVDIAQHIMDTTPNIDTWVHLGDYFDNFGDGPGEVKTAANKVKTWLDDPLITNIMGNHDLSYGWGSIDRIHSCSGWTRGKSEAILSVLKRSDWSKFDLYAWIDGWFLSHAGFDSYFVRNGLTVSESIEANCDAALSMLRNPYLTGMYNQQGSLAHPILMAGRDRGGRNIKGGILWCDWDSLQSPLGFNQMVGHTPHEKVIIEQDQVGARTICLDTHLHHFAIIEDGDVEIKKVEYD